MSRRKDKVEDKSENLEATKQQAKSVQGEMDKERVEGTSKGQSSHTRRKIEGGRNLAVKE